MMRQARVMWNWRNAMNALKSYSLGLLLAVGLFIGLAGANIGGQSRPDSIEAHVAAAKAAAGTEHKAVFDTLCAAPAPPRAPQPARPAAAQPQKVRRRAPSGTRNRRRSSTISTTSASRNTPPGP